MDIGTRTCLLCLLHLVGEGERGGERERGRGGESERKREREREYNVDKEVGRKKIGKERGDRRQ